ncbi:MAG: pyridoxal-dependent decarboxylase [bacterium]|nr:pyridoxal-dependent decarboxylase [bacterium]
MDIQEFRRQAHELVDWMANYLENVREFPVKSQSQPGEILEKLPESPPDNPEKFEKVFADFEQIILPGITHWQHPSFFAYFPANSSPPSLLGEMLTSTLAAQCMSWQTSPAAAELEECVTNWLKQMLDLPELLTGVIQDTASTATLSALLTARETRTGFLINEKGFDGKESFTIYCSEETHSSIEKDVKIAGFGKNSLRKIAVDNNYAMIPDNLEQALEYDKKAGYNPLCVVATIGTTGSTAVDPLRKIGEICHEHSLWLHVDAAFSGTALILPEMRWMSDGMEYADSFVFNPHKWMLTNFDCSAYFVRDQKALVQTFEILPEYLKTGEKKPVKNYRDWGIQLGRRFRALKLWFVIRNYGLEGLRAIVRGHIELAQSLSQIIETEPDFELLAPVPVSLVCFRFHPPTVNDETELNQLNETLLDRINKTGKLFLTHTKLSGKYTLRMSIAQTQVTANDVNAAWETIRETARAL